MVLTFLSIISFAMSNYGVGEQKIPFKSILHILQNCYFWLCLRYSLFCVQEHVNCWSCQSDILHPHDQAQPEEVPGDMGNHHRHRQVCASYQGWKLENGRRLEAGEMFWHLLQVVGGDMAPGDGRLKDPGISRHAPVTSSNPRPSSPRLSPESLQAGLRHQRQKPCLSKSLCPCRGEAPRPKYL